MALSPDPSVGAPSTTGSVQQCANQCKEALKDSATIGATDKANFYFLLGAQDIPFDGAGQKTAAIFQPKDSDFPAQSKDFKNPITEAVTNIAASINNPLSGVLGTQGQLFGQGLDAIRGFGAYDSVQAALRSYFLLADKSDSNLAGLLLFAIEETMPTMTATVDYIAKMEQRVKQVMEGCSKLPASFIPEIPNLVILRNLCKADQELNTVLAELSAYQTLDQATLASAVKNVCDSKDIVKSGIVPPESLALLKSVFSLTDLQVSTIASSRFTPDPSFRLKLDQIITLNQFIQENAKPVEALNTNILTLIDTLKGIDVLGISTILTVMITVVQGNIQDLRATLEAEVITFIRQNGFTVPDRIRTESRTGVAIYDAGEIESILKENQVTLKLLQSYSNVVNNAETFTQLSALCIVLGRISGMYLSVQKILNQQTKILSVVKTFVKQHIASQCSSSVNASGVDAAVNSFINTATARLSGQNNTNDAIMVAGQTLLTQLRTYKEFINCIHTSVDGGRASVTRAVHSIGGPTLPPSPPPPTPAPPPPSVGDIADLIRFMPQLKTALKTLDLKRITGVEAKEYDALTKLLDGLQCLSIACNNSYIKDVCQAVQVLFRKELNLRKAVAVTQASLGKGEVPSIAVKANVDNRKKQIEKALTDLKQFIDTVTDKVCSSVNTAAAALPLDVLVEPSSIVPVIAKAAVIPLGNPKI